MKTKKEIVSLRVMDSIHYKESFLLGTYMAAFGLVI